MANEVSLVMNRICRPGFLGINPGRLEGYRQMELADTLRIDVKKMNSECGSRKRKSLSLLQEELTERGLKWESISPDEILVSTGHCLFRVREKSGIDIALDYPESDKELSYQHCTAAESDIVDLIETFAELDRRTREEVVVRRLKAEKEQMISDIELPSAEIIVERFLKPRGIRYNLRRSDTHNVLEIQIVNEIWMSKSVNVETLEDDLRFVPYLIKRPDCIKRDGRGFSIVHKWNWNKK